ncbi:MAG: hypothetical protein FWD49_01085 [Firmicutes bacterium]|nr:hypothetical protein [Bacillota bacterium]
MMIKNFDDFKESCSFIAKRNSQIFFRSKTEEEKEEVYCHFARPFYNCLEMYYAVTQHFDVVKNQNKDNIKFIAKYDINWKEKNLSSNETKFLNGMRSYITHYQIPILTIRTAEFPCGLHTQLLISKNSLLGYDGWTKQAKNFIETYYKKTEPIKIPLCEDCEYARENSSGLVQCKGLYKECKDIEIAPIVERCINNAVHFYNWLVSALASECKEEIGE